MLIFCGYVFKEVLCCRETYAIFMSEGIWWNLLTKKIQCAYVLAELFLIQNHLTFCSLLCSISLYIWSFLKKEKKLFYPPQILKENSKHTKQKRPRLVTTQTHFWEHWYMRLLSRGFQTLNTTASSTLTQMCCSRVRRTGYMLSLSSSTSTL